MTEFNNEELVEVISLTDEDGNEAEYEIMDEIEYEGNTYAVLFPIEDAEDVEIIILQIEEEEEMETFSSVEDEAVLEAVYEIFKEKYKDELNFI